MVSIYLAKMTNATRRDFLLFGFPFVLNATGGETPCQISFHFDCDEERFSPPHCVPLYLTTTERGKPLLIVFPFILDTTGTLSFPFTLDTKRRGILLLVTFSSILTAIERGIPLLITFPFILDTMERGISFLVVFPFQFGCGEEGVA